MIQFGHLRHWEQSSLYKTSLLSDPQHRYVSTMSAITIFFFLFLYVHANQSNPSHDSCSHPTPPSNRFPPPAMTHLLPEKLFQHFQHSYLHTPSKDLPPGWGEVVNSITLEKILSENVSTPGEGPLLLNYDVTLHKLVDTGKRRRRQSVEKISGSPVVPASVKSALGDGFSLSVHRVSHRIAVVNTLTAGLAKTFGVRITTEYTIHPGQTGPSISAQDEMHVIISGSCTADIYEGVVRYPFEEHVEEFDIGKDIGDEAAKVDLEEGDLLYLPRGDALSVNGVAILTIRLHTDEITHSDVLNALIDVASVAEDSPLSESLPRSEGEYSYGDLFKSLVKVASVVTEDLRKHFVVGEDIYQEEEDDDSLGIVSDVTMRFLRAAHALLKPGLEVLSEREGIGEWARDVGDEIDIDDGFGRRVEWLKKRDLAEECVAEVFVRWFERRESEEAVEMKSRWEGLRKYGEGLDWVQFR